MHDVKHTEKADQDIRLKERMSLIKHKILVVSGKGGVGKTTVAVNLAYALASDGSKVGIVDVDLHGPNVAKMLGIEKRQLFGVGDGIEPVEVIPNLKAVSLALANPDPDNPIIWRGPMKMSAIKQFLSEANWGELDYLIVDSPPGTGDEPLSVCQLIPDLSGAVIITTPQDVAVLDSRKCIQFARILNVPVIGLIENMSGFVCPHCDAEVDIFKKGGGERAARELNIPFLGRIPLEPDLVEMADSGTPFIRMEKDKQAVRAFDGILTKIAAFIPGSKE